MSIVAFNIPATLAADTRMAWDVDLPTSPVAWLGWLALVLLGIVLIVGLYVRDTRDVHPFWKVWLLVLRLGAWAGLLVIAVNPQERTQTTSFRPSRVVIAVDTSLSMQLPESSPDELKAAGDAASSPANAKTIRPRVDAVRQLLERSPLIAELQRNHDVSLFTFDSTLAGPHWQFRTTDRRVVGQAAGLPSTKTTPGAGESPARQSLNWEEMTKPRGVETRLGESLLDLIRQVSGKSLSGVIVISD
ncbi:MAG TPA: hypothetical protein VK137_09845, partial [Planctomycetaceae bacterium]|nr:hypothetical protein [Planctomycetaceae bacterium]